MSEKKLLSLKLTDYDIGDTIKLIPHGKIKTARSKRNNELIVIKILKKSRNNKINSNRTHI